LAVDRNGAICPWGVPGQTELHHRRSPGSVEDMSQLLKRRFFEQIKVMFGAEPNKPTEIAPAAPAIHFYKNGNRDLIAEKLHARAHAEHKNTWRNRR